jgi:hypothetical protein
MAKLKSAYRPRPKAEIPQPDQPVVVASAEPQAGPIIQAEAKSDAPVLEPKPKIKSAEPEEREDFKRLKQQLADLNHSTELNRRHQQQVDDTNQQINQVFHFWKANGLTADQERSLAANPALMIQLSGFAANEAAKLHPVGSPEFIEAGKKLFFQHLTHLQERAAANAAALEAPTHQTAEAAMQSTPKFFEPDPALVPPQRPVRNNSMIVSAPVSRNGGPSGDYNGGLPTDPSKVRLTRDEVEAAKLSGISATEYARQKLRMLEAKSRGEIV